MSDPDQIYDVLIIGGGPGGLAAALWCADLGLRALLIEKRDEFGGQLFNIHAPITNYPGLETENGREMQQQFMRQVEKTAVPGRSNAEAVDLDTDALTVSLRDGSKVSGRSIVLATGVRRRKMGVSGEDEFKGRGILESGAGSRDLVVGKEIVIVGGGDAALENALILGEGARKVTVIHRGDGFSARKDFVENVLANSRITIELKSRITSIQGGETVENVTVRSLKSGESRSLKCDALLIRVGVEPNTDFLKRKIMLDDGGYIIVNALGKTSESYIFAIGDAANPVAPTISGAVGQAATTIKTIYSLLRA